jgi:hypothetical protein
VRSGPGAARTILLFHTISASPFRQPRMVGSTFGEYSFGLIFVSARTNKRPHHHHQGQYFQPVEPELIGAIKQLAESDASADQYETTIEDNKPVQAASSICSKINNVQCFPARSTRPGQFFHADTIHIGQCWNGICQTLVLVDDCHRKIFPYAMKNRSGVSIADKLKGHCLKSQINSGGHAICSDQLRRACNIIPTEFIYKVIKDLSSLTGMSSIGVRR